MNGIDIHLHLGRWPFPMVDVTPAEMVAVLGRWGFDGGVVSSSLGIVYDFEAGNRWLAEAIAPHPELFGYVVLNLNYLAESEAEIRRCYADPRFVGAKIHPLYCRQKIDSPAGRRLLRVLAEYRRPLLLHTYSSPLESPWNAVRVAQENPGLPIILGHMGGDQWWEGIRAAQEAENLYLEPCSSWADAGKVEAAVAAVGAGRVLFGSDYSLFDPGYALGMVDDAEITPEARAMILGGNARRLFGLN